MSTKTYTLKQLQGFTLPALRKLADLHFDTVDYDKLKKVQLVELLDKHYNPVDDDEIDDLEDDEVDIEADDEEDDEIDDIVEKSAAKPAEKATPPEPNGDTLTAKQVATRIGTDAKTLRKFFRAGVSDFKAVGQGGRYEFAKADLPAIKAAFDKFISGKAPRTKRTDTEKAEPKGRMAAVVDDELDDEEPTPEDLDDLELDDEVDDELELDDDDELDD